MQLLEVVTGHSQFLSDFSILDLVPQAMPTQPVTHPRASPIATVAHVRVVSHRELEVVAVGGLRRFSAA